MVSLSTFIAVCALGAGTLALPQQLGQADLDTGLVIGTWTALHCSGDHVSTKVFNGVDSTPIHQQFLSYMLNRDLTSDELLDFSVEGVDGHDLTDMEKCGQYVERTNPERNGATLVKGQCYQFINGASAHVSPSLLPS